MNDTQHLRTPAAIPALWQATQAIGFTMASEPLTCSLLRTLAAAKPGGRLLELGSGTGLSTAWLLDGMDAGATLLTVDNDEQALAVLREHLGSDPRLTAVCSDGDDFVRSLAGRQFDLIFADTWAGKYRLLDETLSLVAPGGLYVVDDMLPQPNWPEGHGAKVDALVAQLAALDDFAVTTLSWASGLVVATRVG